MLLFASCLNNSFFISNVLVVIHLMILKLYFALCLTITICVVYEQLFSLFDLIMY